MKKVFLITLCFLAFLSINAQNVKAISKGLTGADIGKINATIRQVNDLSAPAYAYLFFQDSSITVNLTADTWTYVKNAVDDMYSTASYNELTVTGDSLTIQNAGHYEGYIKIKYVATASDSIAFALFKNETIASPKHLRVHAGTEVAESIIPFFLPALNVEDDISLRVVNFASSDDISLKSIIWICKYLDE